MAERLAAEADRVAALAPRSCRARDAAARFRADVIASIGRVPPHYREPLMSAANSLAQRLATCTPSVALPAQRHEKHQGKGKHEKRGHDDEGAG